jgi:hypothetical protein
MALLMVPNRIRAARRSGKPVQNPANPVRNELFPSRFPLSNVVDVY